MNEEALSQCGGCRAKYKQTIRLSQHTMNDVDIETEVAETSQRQKKEIFWNVVDKNVPRGHNKNVGSLRICSFAKACHSIT